MVPPPGFSPFMPPPGLPPMFPPGFGTMPFMPPPFTPMIPQSTQMSVDEKMKLLKGLYDDVKI
jgi:hypothetical protein